MFVLDGWISPQDAWYQFFVEEYKKSRDIRSARENGLESFYSFLSTRATGSVLTPDGRVVEVGKTFLTARLKKNTNHPRYFNLYTGEIGRLSYSLKHRLVDFLQLNAKRKLQKTFKAIFLANLPSLLALVFIYSTPLFSTLSIYCSIYPYLGQLAPICGVVSVLLHISFFLWPVYWGNRCARRECKAYAGGHLMFHSGAVTEFIRHAYQEEDSDIRECGVSGRPRHPAYAWYEERGFERRGLTMKVLQAAMPLDEGGKPPSESAIRSWEKK